MDHWRRLAMSGSSNAMVCYLRTKNTYRVRFGGFQLRCPTLERQHVLVRRFAQGLLRVCLFFISDLE